MKIKFGTNRLVIVCRNYVYKLALFKQGRKANKNEYENYLQNKDIVAQTSKHWWGLKQEKLTETIEFPRNASEKDIPKELKPLYKRKIHNRMQVGKDKNGVWKFYDYEDVKFYLRNEDESMYM